MYTLTLSREERNSIDWIGNRYGHGDDLFRLLWCKSTATPDDIDWYEKDDITFSIPENVAWQIAQIGQENSGKEGVYQWDCFGPELTEKLNDFCDKII